MKKVSTITVLILMASLFNICISQTLFLSTENGKTCKINIFLSHMKDNQFDFSINSTWVTDDFYAVVDTQSVIGFIKEKVVTNNSNYIRLIDSLGSTIAFNSSIKLTYEVSENFQGGQFIFKFPFFYASSLETAMDSTKREEFTFKRPRVHMYSVDIQPSDIISRQPPHLAIISPKGVDEGLKSIVDTNVIRIILSATDSSGIENVIVNNLFAIKVNDSIYIADVPLIVGYENTISVTATDKKGKITKKQFPIECKQPIIKTVNTEKIAPSDVDIDIPVVAVPDPLKFALIIGNADYSSFPRDITTESNVDFAIHDAEIFKEYATKIIGIPEENIIIIKNAKVMEMHRVLNQLNTIAKNSKGQASLYVYYSGLGISDEKTHESYLLPVDVSRDDIQFAINRNDFYKKLTEFPTKRITIFLDASFSGGFQDQNLIDSRKANLKGINQKGNIIVFASCSSDQTSLPYRDKQHGIFTYYLLKKLKEKVGEINLYELLDFLSTEVGIRSVLINTNEQNPQTNISKDISNSWKEWMIR